MAIARLHEERRRVLPLDQRYAADGGPMTDPIDRVRLRALTYPEAHEDHPWEEIALKVRGKVFVFLGGDERSWGFSVKLRDTGGEVLERSYARPASYGLGKHGWVSVRFGYEDEVPWPDVERWIDESYRHVAPRTLVKRLR
jgi:predicted DNA-binding protein (MmcQ/YjbR family)